MLKNRNFRVFRISGRRFVVSSLRGFWRKQRLYYGLVSLVIWLAIISCSSEEPHTLASTAITSERVIPSPSIVVVKTPSGNTSNPPSTEALLQESWNAYRDRFIQSDGRVIDWESNSRTVSEGQAYAMLRAVLADDPDTFDRTLQWAENNLRRTGSGQGESLWTWKWGERPDKTWGVIDGNFASDADIDAVTALILASRRWNRADYLVPAREKLADLWAYSTLVLPALEPQNSPRYLLPGPLQAFQPRSGVVHLNPSYLAPYAFRLFAQVDPERDWLALVESSYRVLEQTSQLSANGLPSDWVTLELASQTLKPTESSALKTQYGFDAYRVWWRVALDAAWFGEARADRFLEAHLPYLKTLWQNQKSIPAIMNLQGKALVDYEATSQYAMLYPAFQRLDPSLAEAMRRDKLLTTYNQGIWDNANAYYVQNLAWLGLFPPEQVPATLLK
ncbi:MAG TPA: glycosyl hydrolase family 8 [Trichocoleus sp.]